MAETITQIPSAYEVIHQEYINEIKSQAFLMRHSKTGARVVVMCNDDENKVFNIGFRTPPTDSTGVAHIMEHSVLCGSETFPAKDPFVELVKGSLNTFLNAMTYPDKTIYPIASCNDVDFHQLMHVYLDAVFHPNIYSRPQIFRQEGWHYELEKADAPLTYNGVVYNEMKGAFSSPEQVLYRKITDTLFPDTIYSVESGGDPANIPELTYEQFLDFHRRYYHPANAYLYLYGNMDIKKELEFIDEQYLSHYGILDIDSHIDKQAAFDQLRLCRDVYAAGEEAGDDDTFMAKSWVIGDALDAKLYLAFQILEYALMEAPGAPVKEALIHRNFGKDVYGFYETSSLQPYLSIVIKGIADEDCEAAQQVIDDTLRGLVRDGLNSRTLEGAINYFSFKLKEGDFGRFPAGLMYGIQLMDSWLYDDGQPFIHLRYNETLKFLKSQLDTGYFEQLIQHCMLDNTHASVLVLTPENGLTGRTEKVLAKKLAAYKNSLTAEEVQQLVAETKQLKKYQETPDTKEVLEMIPLLSIKDIRKTAEPLVNEYIEAEGKNPVLRHMLDTKGIGYLTLLFDVRHIPADEVGYLSLMAEVMGNMSTDRHSYQELADEVNLNTGGMRLGVSAYGVTDETSYKPYFSLAGKAFNEKITAMFNLAGEILTGTQFEDTRRIKEITDQLISRLEMSFMSSGHSAAVNRATSYFSQSAWYKELTEGITFYHFLKRIAKDYDTQKAGIVSHLKSIARRVFRPEYLLVDFTGDESGYKQMIECLEKFNGALYQDDMDTEERIQVQVGTCPEKNEAFTTAGTVQYNACAGDFKAKGLTYNGGLHVLKNIMNNQFLWENLRTKGGAYGCMSGFSMGGSGYMVSYRDPHMKESYDIYQKAADYIRQFSCDDRELTKYIIGAVGSLDTPMNAAAKGTRSLVAWLSDTTYARIQKNRDELLAVTQESIRQLADYLDAVTDADYRCTVCSENMKNECSELFEHVSNLMQIN